MKSAKALLVMAGAAGIIFELVGGLGTRLGWFHFRTGLKAFFVGGQIGMYAAMASAALIVFLMVRRSSFRGILPLLISFLLGALAAVPTLAFKAKAGAVPPIHDISTDTEDPPAFVKVPSLRGPDDNSLEYGGTELAEQQKQAYSDLKPLEVQSPPAETFNRALDAARKMGWEIVDENPAEGRIEATDTTLFFGFKDDVVIRVREVEGGSRVDVRSASRVGKSDVGANADRIRAYFRAF